MATRLAAALVAVSFAAVAVAALVGLNTGVDLGRGLIDDRLRSLANAVGTDVSSTLNGTRRLGEALALSPGTATAIDEFDDALGELAAAPAADFDAAAEGDALLAAYAEIYSTVDRDRLLGPINEFVTRNPAAVYLQNRYSIVDGAGTDPSVLTDARDGSTWSDVHAQAHRGYLRVVEELGLIDLYLIEASNARIVYSVGKRPDLGTNLRTGPFSGSVLANAVDEVLDDPDGGAVLTDMALYDATPNEVVGVLATPVLDGERLVGVLAMMYDGRSFTELVAADEQWQQAGSDDSGDVYLISDDGTTRSDPRRYQENPAEFLDESQASGLLSTAERDRIERLGTTVLSLPAVEATARSAARGDDDVYEHTSVTGTEVFGRVVPVEVETLSWYVVTEIDQDIADTAVDEFRNIIVVGTAVFVVFVAFAAVAWAAGIMRPVRAISERLGSWRDQEPLVIAERSPVELHSLATSFEDMSATLDQQQVDLALAREERLDLMRKMLPPAVAERIASGDLDHLDEVPRVSVVVLVVLGLGELVRLDADHSDRELVDRLHEELDTLAREHGIERVKIVGDAYFAACGHDRPFIDHAPRAVTFAAAARDAVVSLSTGSERPLDLAAGVETGPVTVGMTGGNRLVYDVWGDTVSAAHHLARRASPGQILLSDETHAMLPDEFHQTELTIDGQHLWTVASTDASRSEPATARTTHDEEVRW